MIESCTFCNSVDLNYESLYPGESGEIHRIYSCDNCNCFLPDYSTSLKTIEDQVSLHEKIWEDDDTFELEELKNNLKGVVNFISSYVPPHQKKTIIDVGFGRGGLTATLASSGYNAIGCDASPLLTKKCISSYPYLKGKVFNKKANDFILQIREEKREIDGVIFWHSLEHIHLSLNVLGEYIKSMSHNGTLFIQVPMLCRDYIYPEHLFLATPDWFNQIQRFLDINLIGFFEDKTNMYLTGVFSKSEKYEKMNLPIPFGQLTLFERWSLKKENWIFNKY